MTTAPITPAARNAAHQMLQMLFHTVADSLTASPDQLVARDGRITVAGEARSIGFREATGKLRTERISAVASRSDDYGGFGRRFG
jgi:xanthine dehydrogenase YagR molybdenum-binding subunit